MYKDLLKAILTYHSAYQSVNCLVSPDFTVKPYEIDVDKFKLEAHIQALHALKLIWVGSKTSYTSRLMVAQNDEKLEC